MKFELVARSSDFHEGRKWVLLHTYVVNRATGTKVDAQTISVAGKEAQYASGADGSNYSGNEPDKTGHVFLKVTSSSPMDVTPSATGVQNFTYSVQPVDHIIVNLTRAYHPMFTNPPGLQALQDSFDGGSALLAKDDDVQIPDTNPSAAFSTNIVSDYRLDDVPVYIEFNVSNHGQLTWSGSIAGLAYFEIEDPNDALLLYANYTGGASILQVQSMEWDNSIKHGITHLGSLPMIFSGTPADVVSVHEWGHSRGIDERGSANNIGLQSYAIMAPQLTNTGPRINRFEREHYSQ